VLTLAGCNASAGDSGEALSTSKVVTESS